MAKMLPGAALSPRGQRDALASFVHRYTGQHKPDWAREPWKPDGTPYPVQFANDADWLANTLFHATKAGLLDQRYRDCMSTPTWPNNPELRK